MRKVISSKPNFFFNVLCEQEVIAEYRGKYNAIDKILNANHQLLDTVHRDLRRYGDGQQRECPFSSEQIMRMAIVKQVENWSFRETIIRVSESDFLRNFVRIGMGKIMSFAFLCGAINKISEGTWDKVNRGLDKYAIDNNKITPDLLRMDSTVCETNIHYPTDNGLLWDSYRVLSRLMRHGNELHPGFNLGSRFHNAKIKRLYTFVATRSGNKNKGTKRRVKRCMKTLIERVDALCSTARLYVENAKTVACGSLAAYSVILELERVLALAQRVVEQSTRIHLLGQKVPASERVFSIFEDHTELFKRGKAGKPIELGHLISIAQTKEKYISFYDVRRTSLHDTDMKDIALESHEAKFGALPEKFTADKNYYVSMDDIASLEEEMTLCAIGKKGRRTEQEVAREHGESFKAMQRFRAGIEGSISFLKRVLGMVRCLNKGFKHFAATIGRTVFCHNLIILSRA